MVASPTHLASAVVEGNVRVDCVGRKFGRGSALLQIQSLADTELWLEIPTGSIFVPDDMTTQTLIASSDTHLTIEPGASVSVAVDAFCGISENACPDGRMELTRYLAPHDVCHSQLSVWRWSTRFEPAAPWTFRSMLFGGAPTPARDEKNLIEREFPEEADELYEFASERRSDSSSGGGLDGSSSSSSSSSHDDGNWDGTYSGGDGDSG